MTEAEWQSSTDAAPMVGFLQRNQRLGGELTTSRRKLQLFACACAERLLALRSKPGDYPQLRQALSLSRSHADGTPKGAEYAAAIGELREWVMTLTHPNPLHCAVYNAMFGSEVVVPEPVHGEGTGWKGDDPFACVCLTLQFVVECEERQAGLARHIFGNPFPLKAAEAGWLGRQIARFRTGWSKTSANPAAPIAFWPASVVQLAAALYAGQDCRLPLSDALEEVGDPELAEHFRKEEWHPPGCWAMDLILGRS